jgi:hypothetical protein
MVNTIFNYTDIEKCKMQLELNILSGEKNPELNWLTRPDPYHFKIFTTRPDPTQPDPTRGWTRPVTNSAYMGNRFGRNNAVLRNAPAGESEEHTPGSAF